MEDAVPFASQEYFIFLGLLVFSRGSDFLSTWVATPHLVLDGNPIAKWLGWKWGAVVNVILIMSLAMWPLSAIVVATASVLVAAGIFNPPGSCTPWARRPTVIGMSSACPRRASPFTCSALRAIRA